ncbi:MAG: bacillithiol biosynthesis deacetylase BshB1 [Flavobacteriaceae bacterium]|nr:bacillithiol biosynthesis deacetylase BshB1 [Flavobacteriaceae bacterium]
MKLDIVAIGAHPDDVELGCAATLAKSVSQGKKVGIIDLTKGELGTRGTPEIRMKEANQSAKILNVTTRENLGFRDGFFLNDETHQLEVMKKIRFFRPDIILCNTPKDRHVDHGKANALVHAACFLSGLEKIQLKDENNKKLYPWNPKLILEYIQWNETVPDLIVDVSGFIDKKLEAIKAYKSQFFDPESTERSTPISSENFLESISYRAANMGRLIFKNAGEGFTCQAPLSVTDLGGLIS